MANLRESLAKLGGFSAAPLMVSVASVVSVPLLLTSVGESVWVSIAVGQAVGDLARSLVAWSWNSVGLTVIAKLSPEQRVAYYLDSIAPRLLLLLPALVAVTIFAVLWPLEYSLLAWLSAVAGAIFGLNGTWAFIGSREPMLLVLFNSLPRAFSIVVGALLTFFTAQGIWFPLALILGNLAAAVGPTAKMMSRRRQLQVVWKPANIQAVVRLLRSNFSGFTVGFLMAARMSAPVMLAPLVVPAGAGVVALAEKIIRWANTGLTPAMQFIQTGIPSAPGADMQKALVGVRRAWMSAPVVGLVVAVGTPMAASVLSNGQILIGTGGALAVGLIVMSIFAGNVVGNGALVVLGKVGLVAKIALVGLLILLAVGLALPPVAGDYAVIFGFAASEVFICMALTAIVLSLANRQRPPREYRGNS